MKQMLGLLAILAVLVGILFVIFKFTDIRSPFELGTSLQTVSMQTARMDEATDTYAINGVYPQFGIAAIDEEVRNAVESAAQELRDYPAPPADSAARQNTLDVSFDDVYVGPDVVSLDLVLSQYTGGAHPMTILSGMNFDRLTGRELKLDDALALIGKTVEEVSAEATRQFQQKFGDAFFAEGANTNPENYTSFTISADKVTFIFQAYQVAAYAAGPQQVSFERKK